MPRRLANGWQTLPGQTPSSMTRAPSPCARVVIALHDQHGPGASPTDVTLGAGDVHSLFVFDADPADSLPARVLLINNTPAP